MAMLDIPYTSYQYHKWFFDLMDSSVVQKSQCLKNQILKLARTKFQGFDDGSECSSILYIVRGVPVSLVDSLTCELAWF